MAFSGKVVLVTGSSSGIGEDAAFEFANEGAKVVLVGRDEIRLEAVAEKIRNNGSQSPLVVVADVSKDALKIVEKTIEHFGQLDVLVNNAGIFRRDTSSTINFENFDLVLNINLRSIVELTKYAIPYLEKTKGNIINISSLVGLTPTKIATSDAMIKTALDMYTKCASIELAPKGVRVNSVNPGIIKTPIFDTIGVSCAEINIMLANALKNYPIGRIGEVSDTSNAILFLADERSSFCNGILLPIEGGRIHA